MADTQPPSTGNAAPEAAPQPPQKKAKKEKPKEKPLSLFIQNLDICNIGDFTITTEKRKMKNDEGVMEEIDVAGRITKGDDSVHLENDLNAIQLRKLAEQVGVTKGSLNKAQVCYWILKKKNDMGAVVGTVEKLPEKLPSTHCRIIDVLFHRDFVEDFMSFDDARSGSVHETGPGCNYERFWAAVVNAVNRSESTPNKKNPPPPPEITQQDSNPEDSDEDTDEIEQDTDEIELDPYSKLDIRPETDDNKVYNDHIRDAIRDGVNPKRGNTSKVNAKDVEGLVKSLLSIRKAMHTAMKASGSHNRDPVGYTRQAIAKTKVKVRVSFFTAFYFYS